ncbi:hypothetical protein GGR42_002692 [Saonia flava]|uniref:Succinylglutamate desuccinylase/Aspartoacylase catalytic domain-containing protein n=1 Tax=Saonia flava TaxID=523696 RepID=A0A846QV99_9FLAO|nr:succinylglutamate desuccinylase/aspartoacylase family protein [Saonia flava]NJB72201.1 hypothetical protein [Saonia flava]
MAIVYSKALKESIKVNRLVGSIKGELPGPTVIFTGGIHGNEPSGVFALHRVLENLRSKLSSFKGNMYAISGNLTALEKGIRYHDKDLNRLWTTEHMNQMIRREIHGENMETTQQLDIYKTILEILEAENGPFYFVDLHTTSSETKPFATVNDNLLNRKFTKQYPVPLLLGIEEYLEGPLLNYINELGYVAFGFESGQHDSFSSIENHIAFIYLTMVYSGNINKSEVDFDAHYQLLVNATKDLTKFYEIVYHYKIKENEVFTMKSGFTNFEPVHKNQEIAISDGNKVLVPQNGEIFMPLYQKQGNDGFFIIKPIPRIFLNLSALLRTIHADYILPLLPGVSWVSKKRDILVVNLKVAKFIAKKIFHLLGYRSMQLDKTHMVIKNREANSRKKEYQHSIWY